ncbi:MAG: DMT family transporter [Polyangiaceae bacterium]
MKTSTSPMLRGSALALLSALAFGLTMPIIQRLSKGCGVLPAAASLYAGAALASVDLSRKRRRLEAPVRASHWPRLVLVALLGAVAAPVCLIFGLHRTDAVSASLLLNFEAAFTVLLAWSVYREPIGRRVALALVAMSAGGVLLAASGGRLIPGFGIGALAIVLATLAWALDNTLSRPLAELSPKQVVLWKGGLGALLSVALAFALGQAFPKPWPLLGLLACGGTGYGLSLQLYLRAQRRIGAARTGSIFAIAPFVGAGAAYLVGGASVGAGAAVAATCFALGVYLHLTENHDHVHSHETLMHEHAHRHDDGHHDHEHDAPVRGEHSHSHSHEEQAHAHAHAEDVHHRHKH